MRKTIDRNKVIISQNMWLENIQQEIDKTNGKFFSAVFEKSDGTIRKMLCRTGVHKGLTGEGLKYNARERGNVIVWDVQKSGHRTIPLRRLIDIQVNKVKYINSLLPF